MNISSRNGNGTTQACAACKYQRRKCAPDCILAPYFPHDRQRQFLNAHKLFGVSNITKIIKKLDPLDKDQAMRTIIIQSDIRATDPVGGCYRIIQALQAEIEYCRAELDFVLQQLAIFRAQAQAQAQSHHVYNADHHQHQLINAADPLNFYNPAAASHYHYLQPHQGEEQYIMVQDDSANNSQNTPLQQDVSAWAMQNSVSLSSLSLHAKNVHDGGDDYDHHKSMLEIPSDERNELRFHPQEFVDRSDEAILFKVDNGEVVNAEADCMQQAQDHDLKGAATLFSLTNCTS